MKLAAVFGAALIAAAVPRAAQATELFGGLYVHDVKTPLDDAGLESGMDVQLGIRGNTIGHLWHGALQPYAFAAIRADVHHAEALTAFGAGEGQGLVGGWVGHWRQSGRS